VKENVDYELIPADVDNEQAWDIRILTGEFNETVIRFGNIAVDGTKDALTYNFFVVQAPSEYIVESNEDLQSTAGEILIDIIERGIEDGSVVLDERT
jgi:hypothetical protein